MAIPEADISFIDIVDVVNRACHEFDKFYRDLKKSWVVFEIKVGIIHDARKLMRKLSRLCATCNRFLRLRLKCLHIRAWTKAFYRQKQMKELF